MNDQRQIDPAPLLMGRHRRQVAQTDPSQAPPDSQPQVRTGLPEEIVTASSKSHVLTIAPVAEARLRSCIIPNLLTYPGSTVVVDLTGEAYAATAQVRREMGQAVIRLDPFHVIDADSDAMDPLDWVGGFDGAALESACQDLASMISGVQPLTDVWEIEAFALLSGVIGYLTAVPEKDKFGNVYTTMHTDDVVYNLAVVLDTIGGKIPKMAYSEIASFLQRTDVERSRILTSVVSQLKAMASQEAQKALNSSTIPLTEIAEGRPVSVYLMLPPAKALSHFSLLRIWIGTLLRCATDPRFHATHPMLFLLDECAKLGAFGQLQTAITWAGDRQYRIWTFWQELQQLRATYPGSWLIDNCGTLQIFGARDYSAFSEIAAVLGVEPGEIRSLGLDEQIVRSESTPSRIGLIDYPADPMFVGRFSPQP